MLDDILAGLFGGLIEGGIDASVWKRRARKAREAGKVLGAFRVREGTASGLWDRWYAVEATPSPRTISYEAWTLAVTTVTPRSEPLRFSEMAGLQEASPVALEVRTDRGLVEWAIAEEDVSWVMQKVMPES